MFLDHLNFSVSVETVFIMFILRLLYFVSENFANFKDYTKYWNFDYSTYVLHIVTPSDFKILRPLSKSDSVLEIKNFFIFWDLI